MRNRTRGFTMLEIAVAVGVVGVLAASAVALYSRYSLRSRSAEAATNLAAIRTMMLAYFADEHTYLNIRIEPALPVVGTQKRWPGLPSVPDATQVRNGTFANIGFAPTAPVYFHYGCNASMALEAVRCDAAADLDQRPPPQVWEVAWRTESVDPEVGGVHGELGGNGPEIAVGDTGEGNTVIESLPGVFPFNAEVPVQAWGSVVNTTSGTY